MEVLLGGTWRSVCSTWDDGVYGKRNFFNDAEAGIVCRQLGYSTAPPTVQTGDYFPTPAGGGKLYHTAYCNGAEATLLACGGWKTDKDCVDHASVTCAPTKGKRWYIALPTSSQSWCGRSLHWRF